MTTYLESGPAEAGGSSTGADRLRFDRRDVFGGIFRSVKSEFGRSAG